jgi:hypothetical protein
MVLRAFERVVRAAEAPLSIGVLCLAAALETAPAAAKPLELILDPPADRALRYRLTHDTETTIQGGVVGSRVAAEAELTRVVGAASDHVVVRIRFTKVTGVMLQGGKTMPLELGLDGREVQAEVTTRGKVVKVEPTSTGATPEQRRMLENLAEAFFVLLPAEPVSPGGTWKQSLDEPDKSVSGSGRFTFREIVAERGVESARITGEIAIKTASPALDGAGTVVSHVAVQGGYLVASKGSLRLTGQGPSATESFSIELLP